MTVICGPVTDTISYVSKLICGHLVRLYDINPYYQTIEILLDNQQIIGGIGNVSVRINDHKAVISLLSKNVYAGTATISFAVETIEIPPPPVEEATHYLDIYVKPYSWYSPSGVASWLVGKLGDITGTITNLFKDVTDYQYLGTEILTIDNDVVIRLKLRQMGVSSMAAPLLGVVATLVFWLLVIIIGLGVITGWKFTLAGVIEQITGKKYSGQEVIDIVDQVKEEQLNECNKNYPDPNSVAGCQKSVICGASNGLTDALKLTGTDCATLDINQKVDTCLVQYNIDGDKTKYEACIREISRVVTQETKDKAPKEIDWTTILLFGGFALLGLTVISKGAREVVTPVLIERERLKEERRGGG